ncbi:hypothetical protein TMPK1_14280 [Rhodospirillales bacterium TMPK1]|uniref:Uncharacterized protein n=2 Tax=Roseiterribacter gracilis TaxID=2812848 RepID=A0A8S8XBF2_9PROT|nr:hypothetical protein TMPK1_14280 [Rhodospirillales bacterium TMPK1]
MLRVPKHFGTRGFRMTQWASRRAADSRDPVRVALSIAAMLGPNQTRLVPEAPSEKMLEAAVAAGVSREQARAAWRAMLQAETA